MHAHATFQPALGACISSEPCSIIWFHSTHYRSPACMYAWLVCCSYMIYSTIIYIALLNSCLQTQQHMACILPRMTMSTSSRTQLMPLCIPWGQCPVCTKSEQWRLPPGSNSFADTCSYIYYINYMIVLWYIGHACSTVINVCNMECSAIMQRCMWSQEPALTLIRLV